MKLFKDKIIFWSVIILLMMILLSILTQFNQSTDAGDYTDVAKFFAGDYSAKIRTSHSLLYGALHAPLVDLFNC